ncbi:MAG: PKD domain-containing protein [Ardenticatenaceae bacterium]|nr:PKD domain-containing protein [Ardenticatenaceae bacterium]
MSTPLVSTEPGSYTVTLTVNSDGGTMSKTVVDYITVTLGAPVANFSTTPISGTVPLTVTLTDLSTGQPTSWGWDFGDGGTATVQHPSHTYSAAGTYTVTLTVSNTVGSDTATGTVTVLNSVANTAKVVRRISYRFGGQVVATRVVAEDENGQLIDNPAFTGLFYVHGDHLGSATALSYGQDRPTLQGTLVPDSVARFLPFGGYRGAKPQTNPAVSDRGFTGHKHNDDLGLVYMNARYYVPYINRFLSPDTIVPNREDPQSLNRYSYARNNPVKFVDENGHCWGFASGIRDWNVTIGGTTYGGGVNCANIDMALSIVQHPEATPTEKAQAGAYLGGWAFAGATGSAGVGLLGCSTVAPCAAAAETALGIGTTACADGDCTNEASLLGQAVQNGVNAIRNGVGQGYKSFQAFKNAQGAAGEGESWHHIVGQNARNLARFGADRIHNTNNLIRLPDRAGEIHRQVTGYYNSIVPDITGSTTLRVREWLELQSFEYQWQFGIDTLIKFGGQQYIIDQLGNGIS